MKWLCGHKWGPHRRGLSPGDRSYQTTSSSKLKQNNNTQWTSDCWTTQYSARPRYSNSNSYWKISKPQRTTITLLPKNTLTFNGKLEKNEKFENLEDLFRTTLRMQPTLTEEMKINRFRAHLRGLAIKTFKNFQRTPTITLEDLLVVIRRKKVKPESSASAKHRFYRLVFDPERQKLPDLLGELQESAEKAFGDIASQMIESLLYAKTPPHLKKSTNKAYLENGRYEELVRHFQRKMELNGLESEDRRQNANDINGKNNQKKKQQSRKCPHQRRNNKSLLSTGIFCSVFAFITWAIAFFGRGIGSEYQDLKFSDFISYSL